MDAILTALTHTPTWVYVLFALLIWIGIKASKPRVMPLKKLLILPAIFIYMSTHTLLTSFAIHLFDVSIWMGAILLGMIIGWFEIFRNHARIRVDKQQNLIQVPGSWMTLALIIIIFASKYYFSYELDVDPALADQTWFEYSMLSVSGICTGILIGRALCYLYKYQNSSHTALSE